jgi:hypothetical protein
MTKYAPEQASLGCRGQAAARRGLEESLAAGEKM